MWPFFEQEQKGDQKNRLARTKQPFSWYDWQEKEREMLFTNVPFHIEKKYTIPNYVFRQLKLLTMLIELLRNGLFDDV